MDLSKQNSDKMKVLIHDCIMTNTIEGIFAVAFEYNESWIYIQ